MTILFLAALLGGDSILPLDPGSKVTFDGRTFEVENLKTPVEIVEADGSDVKFVEASGKHFLALAREGRIEYVIGTAGNTIKIFKAFHRWYVLELEIPKELKAGLAWKSRQVFLCCGFGSREVALEAVADGDAISVRSEGTERIALKRGHGIVRWKG